MTGAAREPESIVDAAGAAGGQPAAAGGGRFGRHAGGAALVDDAELVALRDQLAERTADLQRVTAEYANYRKRVDRDRVAVVDAATRSVLAALLPVLDDIDRARAHGDLIGAFKAVADQLEATLEKLGLQSFGEPGERFDPTVHEAVVHTTSPNVTEPTCVSVLRRGFRYGDRLLRAPLVAVADPEPVVVADEPVSPTDLPDSEAADWFAGTADSGFTGSAAAGSGAAGGGSPGGGTAGTGTAGGGTAEGTGTAERSSPPETGAAGEAEAGRPDPAGDDTQR